MASQLTTPTHHMMLPSHWECHYCRYFTGKEMVEGSWEHDTLHEGLAQYRFYCGKFKNYLQFPRTGKEAFLGVWWKYIIGACCWFPKMQLWSTHGYLPPQSKTDPSDSCMNSSSTSPSSFLRYVTFMVLRQDSTVNKGYLWLTYTAHPL